MVLVDQLEAGSTERPGLSQGQAKETHKHPDVAGNDVFMKPAVAQHRQDAPTSRTTNRSPHIIPPRISLVKQTGQLTDRIESFAGHQLDLTPVTAQNRSELALDDAARALWAIGPFAEYHGDSLEQLCTPANSNIRSVPGQNNPLPGAEDEVLIPAFVTGRFDGELPEDKPYPFVITVNNIIVASGETWQLRGSQLYFTMVEPKIVNAANFNPQAWIYTPDACLGGSADSP